MPFKEEMREVYEQIYKSVCHLNDLECWRVDEISTPGSITKDIVVGIIEADIIIADLTHKNPNVFYELGIAHSSGNKTLMTSQHKSDVPFDIANYRIIFYEQTISGSKEFLSKLDAAIKEMLKSLDQTNNPVQEVLSNRSMIGAKKNVPLIKVLNYGTLPSRVRKMIEEEGVIYAEEMKELNLEELKVKHRLGRDSLGALVAALLKYDLYHDIKQLNDLASKYRLDTKSWRYDSL